jgi:hypothetical protein
MHRVNKVKSYFNFPRQQFEIIKNKMVQIIVINEHNNYE